MTIDFTQHTQIGEKYNKRSCRSNVTNPTAAFARHSTGLYIHSKTNRTDKKKYNKPVVAVAGGKRLQQLYVCDDA